MSSCIASMTSQTEPWRFAATDSSGCGAVQLKEEVLFIRKECCERCLLGHSKRLGI